MQIIGHRGWRGLYPENTLVGFEKAISLGVDAIELDVVVSADKQIVVSHEPFMSSITCVKPNGIPVSEKEHLDFNLFQMPYHEIMQFDCGLKKNPKFPKQQKIACTKPLLHTVFSDCEAHVKKIGIQPITYIIEVKSKPKWVNTFYPPAKEYVSILLQELQEPNFHHRIVLKSFDVHISNEIKRQAPQFKQSLLINRNESVKDKLQMLQFKPEILGPYFELFNSGHVSYYQQENLQILPWTVNELTDMKRLMLQKVDGIITDYPDRLKTL